MAALGLRSEFGGEHGAQLAIGAEEAHFHQLARGQQAVELGHHGWRDPGLADFERGGEDLPESAQTRLLGASQRRK